MPFLGGCDLFVNCLWSAIWWFCFPPLFYNIHNHIVVTIKIYIKHKYGYLIFIFQYCGKNYGFLCQNLKELTLRSLCYKDSCLMHDIGTVNVGITDSYSQHLWFQYVNIRTNHCSFSLIFIFWYTNWYNTFINNKMNIDYLIFWNRKYQK